MDSIPATPIDVVALLMLRSYAANRRYSPSIQPHQWAPIFPNWEALEAAYQASKGA